MSGFFVSQCSILRMPMYNIDNLSMSMSISANVRNETLPKCGMSRLNHCPSRDCPNHCPDQCPNILGQIVQLNVQPPVANVHLTLMYRSGEKLILSLCKPEAQSWLTEWWEFQFKLWKIINLTFVKIIWQKISLCHAPFRGQSGLKWGVVGWKI